MLGALLGSTVAQIGRKLAPQLERRMNPGWYNNKRMRLAQELAHALLVGTDLGSSPGVQSVCEVREVV